jgi:hypothetical protein
VESLGNTFVTKSYAKGKTMPMVDGKKFPYTKAGMAAAKKAAAKKMAKPMSKKKPMKRGMK